MEVFMRNLPPDLAEGGLRTQLRPFMDQLSITDYAAEKQRGKNTGRLTFLHRADAKRFLERYGEEPLPQNHHAATFPRQPRGLHHPPTRARLALMGNQVFCKPSNRQPEELALRSIEHEAHQRRSGHYDDAPPEPVNTLQGNELSCGYHSFIDGQLTFTTEWTARERLFLKFAKRHLIISLDERAVQLRVPFQSIVELVWWQDGSAAVTLSSPPVILASQPGAGGLAAEFANLGLRQAANQRRAPQRQRLEAVDSAHAKVSAFCLVYHFRVPSAVTRHANTDFHREISRIRHKELFPVTRYQLGMRQAHHASPKLPGYSQAVANLRSQIAQYHTTASLPFGLLFLLEGLITNSYLHPATVSALAQSLVQLFAATKQAGSDRDPVSVDAFKKLFEWIDYPSPDGDPRMFSVDGIMEYLQDAERLIREGAAVRSRLSNLTRDRASIFRAVVTPTRVTLHGPELEPMNRVLRKFSDHSYFIRVQFCDEDGQDLFFNAKVSLDNIYARFKRLLSSGIQVAGRVYKLLGFSHSSLRAHSAWLSAPFFYQEHLHFPDLIIAGLGDFGSINSPARRAARIGQAFSETPYAVDLDENVVSVLKIDDVERNGRVFSDGVGTISPEATEAVYKAIPESKGYPTCFQIRWGGAKGMLSLNSLLEGNAICIRPSMVKFESKDRDLEICDMASQPMSMVLNRQLIKILEDMGAPGDWFLDLQAKEVRRLRGITATVFNTASFVHTQKIGESVQLHKFLRQTETMGVDYRRDPFLRAVIEALLLREIRLLKHKARIPVRKGMTLFGIMDETGYLKEGEVYVAFDMDGRRFAPPPLSGVRVVVTRSPALHPGDVQIAYTTAPPDGHPLLEHRNCIVFSQWGDRDLPSQLSGGDLDGDVFHVIWDPDVVGFLSTFKPADYARVPPLELDRPVTLADMADFFVDFMRTDHLGVIATRHMILADQQEDGTLDKDCIRLAELHSSAVDFSKTGRPVELAQLPRSPRWRPDFFAPGPTITIHDKSAITMDQYVAHQDNGDDEEGEDGPRHQYYRSEKILGQLYRAVDEGKVWAEDIRMTIAPGGPSFWDQLLTRLNQRVRAIGPVEWQHRSAEAHRIRHAYEDAFYGLMLNFAEHPHQPLRELEVFVGFIMNKTSVQTHRQRDRCVKLKDEFERIAAWITQEIRSPASLSGYRSELDALELCLACLHVGCLEGPREVGAGHRSSAQDIESFKIVAAAALTRELNSLEKGTAAGGYAMGGGGYLGVRGRAVNN